MVGAGSVVTSDVPPGTIVVGNPARVVSYDRSGTSNAAGTAPQSGEFQSKIPGVRWIPLTAIKDVRGQLVVAQWDRHLPFVPQRTFFVHGVPSRKVRGEHAHKVCEQILVAITGSINVVVDNGKIREEYILDDASRGFYVPPGIWATQYRYSSDAVMAVFASHDYDESDYIRDYEAYLAYSSA